MFIQQCQILSYPEPDAYDLKFMQRFLHSPDHMDLALLGPDANIWGSLTARQSYSRDLTSLCPRQKEDPFSSWVATNAVSMLKKRGWNRMLRSSRAYARGIVAYEDARIFQITYWITSVVASLLPISSILILYRVQSTSARLGIVVLFNVLVSLCLNAFTSAKRAEVFAITAA